jgi:nucleotide-binding universal stress UspA family protein
MAQAVAREPAMGKVVVGVDGSPDARRALVWALEEAAFRDSILEVVYAWRMPMSVMPAGMPVPAPDHDECERAARALIEDEVALALEETAARPPVHTLVMEGRPYDVLLSHAENADLLVLGSRGAGPISGLLLGSVSLHCVRHATTPIAIVPASDCE